MFGEKVVLSQFDRLIAELLTVADRAKRALILPVYVVGILGSLTAPEFIRHLKEIIVFISLEENGWSRDQQPALKDAINIACTKSMERKQEVLNLMCEMVTHPANYVRNCVVLIFSGLISLLNLGQITERILPALTTLAADPETTVRNASIQTFGTVALSNLEDKEIMTKTSDKLDSLLNDEKNRAAVIKVYTKLIPSVPAPFRDVHILPNILRITEKEHHLETRSADHKKLNQLIFESYRALNGCVIDEEAISRLILPGLMNIQAEAEPSYKQILDSMVHDMQNAIAHLDVKNHPENSGTGSMIPGRAFLSKVSTGWTMPSMSMGMGMPGRKKE